MLTLGSYVGYVRRPSRARWEAVVIAFALGLLAKPMLVTLPFVLLLLDVWPLARTHGAGATRGALVREKIPLFALAAAASVVTVIAQRHAGALASLGSAPLSYRVGNALVSYATYLRKTVWPSDLSPFYPPATTLSAWTALAAAAVLGALTALTLAYARRAPYVLVGWLWFLGMLVPVIGIVRQGDQAMADRFTYLPSIGLFVLVAWAAEACTRGRRAARRASVVGGMLALAACLAATAQQIGYWEDSETLFAHALAVDPDNYVAHANLGVALDADGRHDEAMAHFARAIAAQPTYAKGHLNLGNALAHRGRGDAAEAEYREALRLDPRSAPAAYDLGLLLAERGALDDAIALYHRALTLDPSYTKAWNNLGWALASKGALDDAVGAYEHALALDPTLTAAQNGLAVALEGLGRTDEALAHYAAAVRLAPAEPRAHANYAAVLANVGRYDEAIASYREALRLAPDLPEVREALAEAVASRARHGGAPRAERDPGVMPPP